MYAISVAIVLVARREKKVYLTIHVLYKLNYFRPLFDKIYLICFPDSDKK